MFKLNLYIHKIHPYIKFQLNVCNSCLDNDQKVKDDRLTEGQNDRTGSHYMP